MTTIAYIWMIILAIAALLFFGIAATLAVQAIDDLRHLLSRTKKRD